MLFTYGAQIQIVLDKVRIGYANTQFSKKNIDTGTRLGIL